MLIILLFMSAHRLVAEQKVEPNMGRYFSLDFLVPFRRLFRLGITKNAVRLVISI